jgi:CBS domain-containing protein
VLHSISVKDYMSTSLVTFTPDMDVMTAIAVLVERGISGAPVVDRLGNLVGMLSEKDCLKVALSAGYHGEWGGRVAEFMSHNAVTVDVNASVLDVAKKFIESPFKRFPVVDENELVGQISRADVLRAIAAVS